MSAPSASPIKVSDVIERLRSSAGSNWTNKPWDGLEAGSIDAAVKGIAVAWSPDLTLLKQAAAQGCNLVLAKVPLNWHENSAPAGERAGSTFREGYAGNVKPEDVEKTGAWKAKKQFIDASGLNVVRISENWDGPHSRATEGLLQALGWKSTDLFVADPGNPNLKTAIVTIPPLQIAQIAKTAKARVNSKAARLFGDPAARVKKIAVLPSYMSLAAAMKITQTPGVELVVTGETEEWSILAHMEDWVSAGHGKGLIMLGLAPTSDTATHLVADWVRKAVPGVKVTALRSGDPFTQVMAGRVRA